MRVNRNTKLKRLELLPFKTVFQIQFSHRKWPLLNLPSPPPPPPPAICMTMVRMGSLPFGQFRASIVLIIFAHGRDTSRDKLEKEKNQDPTRGHQRGQIKSYDFLLIPSVPKRPIRFKLSVRIGNYLLWVSWNLPTNKACGGTVECKQTMVSQNAYIADSTLWSSRSGGNKFECGG